MPIVEKEIDVKLPDPQDSLKPGDPKFDPWLKLLGVLLVVAVLGVIWWMTKK